MLTVCYGLYMYYKLKCTSYVTFIHTIWTWWIVVHHNSPHSPVIFSYPKLPSFLMFPESMQIWKNYGNYQLEQHISLILWVLSGVNYHVSIMACVSQTLLVFYLISKFDKGIKISSHKILNQIHFLFLNFAKCFRNSLKLKLDM